MGLFNPQLVPVGQNWSIDTRALCLTVNVPVVINTIVTGGYYTKGDGGGATYKRVAAQPAHNGKFQSKDGAWWELSANPVNVRMFGAKGDGVADDTNAFTYALAFANTIFVPNGSYRITFVDIASNKTIIGESLAAKIYLTTGAAIKRPFNANGVSNVTIKTLSIMGEAGAMDNGIYATTVFGLVLDNLYLEGITNHNITLDNCTRSKISNISFGVTGSLGGNACIYLANFTAPGSANTVENIYADGSIGRVVVLVQQLYCTVSHVTHVNVNRGESVYFLNCSYCSMDNVMTIGGGDVIAGNPGNDGIAVANSLYCNVSECTVIACSGHGISIGADDAPGTGDTACLGCTVSNCRIIAPNEAGIAVTNQGIAAMMPTNNLVVNCYVENPGVKPLGVETGDIAFAAFGCRGTQFMNCVARDSRGPGNLKMYYGFAEGGTGTPGDNHFQGYVNPDECTLGAFNTVYSDSSFINTSKLSPDSRVTFDGSGAVGAAPIFFQTDNIASVEKTASGTYKVTLKKVVNARPNISISSRFQGGATYATVNDAPVSQTVFTVFVADASGAAANPDYVSVVIQ